MKLYNTIFIDDIEYHADYDGNVLLDEYDEPIPAYLCICCAESSCACICGAYDREVPDYQE